MADFTPNRPGQVNGGGAADALFLKVFSGEVMKTFQETNVMKPLHRIRNIQNGKSAQFVAIGTAAALYHTPGAELGSGAILQNERTIQIDGVLLSRVFVANLDEAMSHYDIRGPYAEALGRALAKAYDQKTIQTAVLAARAATTVTGGFGGSALTNPAFASDGEALADGLFDAAQAMDEKDVPTEGRFVIVKPAQYYALARSTKVINKDWDGSGSFAKGKVHSIAGIEIVQSNNLPTSVISNDGLETNTYGGTFTNTVGIVFQREAVGSVHLLDLAMEKEYSVRHQGTLMVAKMAVGHGILRPECAVELKTA